MFNEFNIISRFKSNFNAKQGIGDDAATLGKFVITKDILAEDVHFRRSYFDGKTLAIKALEVNFSDVAAMGGKPTHCLLGISVPANLPEAYLDDFISSFINLCKEKNVELIGGDTTGSIDKLFISVTMIGETETPKYRDGAKVGDLIAVCGNLGYAHLGLCLLEKDLPGYDEFKAKLLKPCALISEGIKLANLHGITAMMDISDGLLTDLKKLCMASGVSAKIDTDRLNNSHEFYEACEYLKLDPVSVMLQGGEDYGLLVTINPENAAEILENKELDLKIIGEITSSASGVVMLDPYKELSISEFNHFS